MLNKVLLILMLSTSVCFGAVEGVWTGSDYKADTKVLYAGATVISADTETGVQTVQQEPDIKDGDTYARACVELDGGECQESEYFKVTIKDVKG
jgi:hypothetical protein